MIRVFMYVCMHVCMYVRCTYTHTHIQGVSQASRSEDLASTLQEEYEEYTCTHIHIQTYTQGVSQTSRSEDLASTLQEEYEGSCTIYIYIYIHTHTYIYIYIHICIYTYIHTLSIADVSQRRSCIHIAGRIWR